MRSRLLTLFSVALLAVLLPFDLAVAGGEADENSNYDTQTSTLVPGSGPAYRIRARVDARVYDDDDCLIGCTFEAPPGWQSAELTRTVELANGTGGALHDESGFRRRWWRGPFIGSNGLGFLPEHDDAHLCFRNQAAWWSYDEPSDLIWVRTHPGFFVGSPLCDMPSDHKHDEELSVAAAPGGNERCDAWSFEKSGDSADVALCLSVERIDPIPIAFPRTGNAGPVPFHVEWDASPSIVDGQVIEWLWDMGDGTTFVTPGPWAGHTYQTPGRYPVTLRITDSNGLSRAEVIGQVRVYPPTVGPVAVLTGPTTTQPNQPVTFDASASTPGNRVRAAVLEYWWDFGDGTLVSTRNPQSTWTHTYTQPGIYTVSVTIFTNHAETDTDTLQVNVRR